MQPDTYVSCDFQSIIWLFCNDAKLTKAERISDKKVAFVFSNRGFCEGLVQQMFFDESVPLSRVLSEIKKARSIIHATN